MTTNYRKLKPHEEVLIGDHVRNPSVPSSYELTVYHRTGLPADHYLHNIYREDHPVERLFYFEEGVNAWCPLDNLCVDSFGDMADGEEFEVRMKKLSMTQEEFDNLPEL